MKFLGYQRPDGSVGIRNYVLVIPGGLVGSKICDFVEGTKTITVASDAYFDHTSRDRETVGRTLIGLGRSPNVAAVIIDTSINGAGYPEYTAAHLFEEISKSGKRVELLNAIKEGGTLASISKGIQLAREMVHDASKLRRQPFDLSHLVLAVKCGASDTTSGIAGNPVIGNLFDRVIGAGGTALFGENTEIVGAEQVLAKRAVNERVANDILQVAHDIEEVAKSTGEDIRTMNPIPANIAGGISTLEEKSLGAICKSGSAPIQGVLKYGERPAGQGLYFFDNNPAMGIYFGYAASGAQLLLFQLGGGGYGRTDADMLLTPGPGVIAPLLWATANPRTLARSSTSIDFYSGTVLEGEDSIESAGEKLLQQVVDIASGTFTKVESIKQQEPSQMYLRDPIF
ncbi:MAG: UxaA family hydrolase [Pseudomonadales bacterium]|jgi:altronate dehydratase large subunit|nr:UxaA family hydrolase [Pseudomonadales bacterium]MDP7597208.1 UxaA family hydrolase [Pseudomonadales bacterium]HJN51908.1 UxaA family hydrolase [Pseudomonadales bacterium]|tara:strand:+ start:1149 stop:2345 length:1197 start_codon:yes stop_codon:yes gene_type:complete